MKTKPTYLCFPARKGGVGKTMLAFNTAAFFANEGKRVLLVGADSQEDVTEMALSSLEDYDLDNHVSLCDVIEGVDIRSAIVRTPDYTAYQYSDDGKIRRRQNGTFAFDMIPAGTDIDSHTGNDIFAFRNLFSAIENEYDYIIFDTPPSESEVVWLVLMACDYAIIPVSDMASFKSVLMVLDNIELAKENGSYIKCLGVVINNHHTSWKLDKYNEQVFRESLENMTFKNVIRTSASISNAAAFNVPVCSFENSSGCEDLYRFYEELKEKLQEVE